MKKPNFSQVATKTLQQETQAIQDRFSKADEILLKRHAPAATAAQPDTTRAEQSVVAKPTPKQKKEKKKTGPKPGEPRIKDIFSFPEQDYAMLAKISQRAAQYGTMLNKSQIVRLALQMVDHAKAAEFELALRTFVQRELARKTAVKDK